MNIGLVCRRGVVTVDRMDSLLHAAERMRDHHVGALVVTAVTDTGPHVVGIVTDRDLVVGGIAGGLDGAQGPVGTLASTRVASVSEDADLSEAVTTMQTHGVRRLLVTDAMRRLVGFVSLDDLVDAYASEMDGLAQVIRSGIEREASEIPMPPAGPVTLPHFPATGTAGWQA
jgi:CBS domain-containing protein